MSLNAICLRYRASPHLSALCSYAMELGCCFFAGCLTTQQHASVSQGRICSDSFTCCHTEVEAANQTFYLTQSQYTDTGPTSPGADPITPGTWQGVPILKSLVSGMTRPGKKKTRRKRDSKPGSSALETDALTTRPTRRWRNRALLFSRVSAESRVWLGRPRWPGDKVSASRAGCLGIQPCFAPASGTSDLTGTLLATLPGEWCHRVNAGTGWPGVSIESPGEWIWSATLFSVWQHVYLREQIRPRDTLCTLLGC